MLTVEASPDEDCFSYPYSFSFRQARIKEKAYDSGSQGYIKSQGKL